MTEDGDSPAVEQLASSAGLAHRRLDSCGVSHLAGSDGGSLGLAVLSRFPIVRSEFVRFSDLGLDGPDGSPYVKGVQCLRLDLQQHGELGRLDLLNLHMPAVHIFGRQMDEPAFGSLHIELDQVLAVRRSRRAWECPTVVTGDFNNRELPLAQAFPELQLGLRLRQAITARSTVLGHPSQSDHILVSPDVEVFSSAVRWTTSDHAAVYARLDIPVSAKSA